MATGGDFVMATDGASAYQERRQVGVRTKAYCLKLGRDGTRPPTGRCPPMARRFGLGASSPDQPLRASLGTGSKATDLMLH